MTKTFLAKEITNYFHSRSRAEAICAQIREDDPETDYRVIESQRGFFIAIVEDGNVIFTL